MNMNEKNEDTNEFKEDDVFPKETYGIRHLVECNCILPQYKNRTPVVWHKFPVFSIINEKNEVIHKFAQCTNCGIIHKIIEIGKSEVTLKENLKSIRTIQDIKFGIQPDVAGLLEQYKCDVSVWEQSEFILHNKKWGSMVILDHELDKGTTIGKALVFQGSPVLARVESFTRQEIIG